MKRMCLMAGAFVVCVAGASVVQTLHARATTLLLTGQVEGFAPEGRGPLAFHFFDEETGRLAYRTLAEVVVSDGEYSALVPVAPIAGGGTYLVGVTPAETSLEEVGASDAEVAAALLPLIPVWLQNATPGTQQIGHANISGLLIVGAIQTGGFRMATGAGVGRVLTSDASGFGTWQALPPPSGSAGGDLGGTYPNPTVVGLQARPVDSAAPTAGDVLKWNGSIWSPSADLTDMLWQVSGTNIYYTAGKVGIGATNPDYQLHVQTSVGAHAIYGHQTSSVGFTSGVYGQSDSPFGKGVSGRATGIFGKGVEGAAQSSNSSAYGVLGLEPSGGPGHAVFSDGSLAATGTKSFQIDHPLDPVTFYLNHFCTEGPAPMNAYSGNVVTDAKGYATIALPDYFESINRDFRYQLTIVDDGEREDFVLVKVVRKIQDNQFRIRTSAPRVEVSWRVEAIRNDRWVQAYGYQTVQEKEDEIKGKYLHPELFGMPERYGIHYHPDDARPAPASRQGSNRSARSASRR